MHDGPLTSWPLGRGRGRRTSFMINLLREQISTGSDGGRRERRLDITRCRFCVVATTKEIDSYVRVLSSASAAAAAASATAALRSSFPMPTLLPRRSARCRRLRRCCCCCRCREMRATRKNSISQLISESNHVSLRMRRSSRGATQRRTLRTSKWTCIKFARYGSHARGAAEIAREVRVVRATGMRSR